MPSTLLRYFLKRWSLPLLGALLFYGGLLLASDMVRESKEIFSQSASFLWLIPILTTTLPETFAIVLPMAAVLGGFIGTQNLSEGSEMVASQGLGVGMRAILKPWLLLSSGLVLLAALNAHLVVPKISTLQTKLKAQMMEETKTRRVRPGAPPWYLDGGDGHDVCVWVAETGEIHLMEAFPEGVQHVIAKDLSWFRYQRAVENRALILELSNIQGCLVQGNDRVSHLNEKSQRLKIPLPEAPRLLSSSPLRYLSTPLLLTLRTPTAWKELCRRLTLPVSVAALLLLGIALGLSHPRFHQGGGILKSLGVVLAYYLMLQYFENRVLAGNSKSIIFLLLEPFLFLLGGLLLLYYRLRPHHSNHSPLFEIKRYLEGLQWCSKKLDATQDKLVTSLHLHTQSPDPIKQPGILQRWTRRLWWRQWGAVMGTFLVLSLMMEFAQLAGDLSKNKVSYWTFIQYWLANLPPFLAIVLPVAFLLGGILAFSDAAQSREWTALRAGGTSLLQWIGSGFFAWAPVLALTLLMAGLLAPALAGRRDLLYQKIKNKPVGTYQTKSWLHLGGSTGILWHLDGDHRWGFPLNSPGSGASILLRWKQGDSRADSLEWGGLAMRKGPLASSLFPEKALLESGRMEETSTWNLLRWQKWAPDPERASLLWGRLLDWLAGPCLLFAMLGYAFPAPRSGGRGRALGFALVAGLAYLGMQALFGGAAKSGEIPPIWGVGAPLLLLLGFGLLRLNRLRT